MDDVQIKYASSVHFLITVSLYSTKGKTNKHMIAEVTSGDEVKERMPMPSICE
jgi:hypothetical protein